MNPAVQDASPTHLLYLHGLHSSPKSFKAQRLAAWLAAHRPDIHWRCPQLPPSPREAMVLLQAGIAGWPCVVINPAVNPARDLQVHIDYFTLIAKCDELLS